MNQTLYSHYSEATIANKEKLKTMMAALITKDGRTATETDGYC